jgi:hypothetical protein
MRQRRLARERGGVDEKRGMQVAHRGRTHLEQTMTRENRAAAVGGKRWSGHVIAAAALYTLDAFILEQGAIATLVAVVMATQGLIYVVLGVGENRARLLHGLRLIAIYFGLVVAVVATLIMNNAIALVRATRIVGALKLYKAKHGRYPERLQDLVPEYMPWVPLAKDTLLFNAFHYWHHDDDDGGCLMYTIFPPFGRRIYGLADEKWSYID